jgi:hypothetical protein
MEKDFLRAPAILVTPPGGSASASATSRAFVPVPLFQHSYFTAAILSLTIIIVDEVL